MAATKSAKFDMLAEKWANGYITISTLRGWVKLNAKKSGAGITAEEFKEITGEEYENG